MKSLIKENLFTALEDFSKANKVLSNNKMVIAKLGNKAAVSKAFFSQSLHYYNFKIDKHNILYLEHFVHGST